MSQLGLQFRPTPTSIEDHEWTELEWETGRIYRWRLDRVREYGTALCAYADSAPPEIRWEVEFLDPTGSWRKVRHYARRDEIWRHIRGEVLA